MKWGKEFTCPKFPKGNYHSARMKTWLTHVPGKCCNHWTSDHLIAFKYFFYFFFFLSYSVFPPLLIISLILKSSRCLLENLEKHSFLETILLICSLPHIAFFLYYYANAFGRKSVYFWRIVLLRLLICVWSHSHLILVNAGASVEHADYRSSSYFPYVFCESVWRDWEFAVLSYLRFRFYFHWVFTKMACIRKGLAAFESHSPADL